MDTEQVREAAGRVATVAVEVRTLARRVAATADVRWQSTAASAFRQRLGQEAERLRATADRVDGAADALRRHAAACDIRQGWP